MPSEPIKIDYYPSSPKWEFCVDCGQPVRHELTRWCAEHDPNRHRPTPWYMWGVYVPLIILAAIVLLGVMGALNQTMPY